MLTKKKFNELLKITPMIVVDGVLFRDNAVLMIKRAHEPFKGFWGTPGGFVEYKEKLEDAIVRETKEETGLDVRAKKLVGIYSNPDRDPRGHVISVCFLLELVGGKMRTSSETSDVKFFKKLPNKIVADHRQMLIDAKKMITKIK